MCCFRSRVLLRHHGGWQNPQAPQPTATVWLLMTLPQLQLCGLAVSLLVQSKATLLVDCRLCTTRYPPTQKCATTVSFSLILPKGILLFHWCTAIQTRSTISIPLEWLDIQTSHVVYLIGTASTGPAPFLILLLSLLPPSRTPKQYLEVLSLLPSGGTCCSCHPA